jgi:peptidoglycan/LPS O-acetylase OafA/YrhL
MFSGKKLLWVFLLELTVTIGISMASYHLFEKKFLSLKEKFRR